MDWLAKVIPLEFQVAVGQSCGWLNERAKDEKTKELRWQLLIDKIDNWFVLNKKDELCWKNLLIRKMKKFKKLC